MAVNLINSDDIEVIQTNNDIKLGFGANRKQQLSKLEQKIIDLTAWKYFDTISADNTLTLPETFNELFIAVRRTGTSRTVYLAEIIIPYVLLEDNTVEINIGGRLTLQNQGCGAIGQISKTTYQTSACYLSTSAITDYETVIYYR